jgi:iron complex outermembrane receptor protein
MAIRFRLSLLVLAAAASVPVGAQVAEVVTITGRANVPNVSGFGTMPLAGSPLQAAIYSAGDLADIGATSLAGLAALDAGVSDAYNAEGYWSMLSMRGFVLDNRSNYRRDGLPINAETAITLANKERIEVFKGTSGIQAGTSAPGGLVNLVVKRPNGVPVRQARLDWRENGTIGAQVDLSDRFGAEQRFGLRVNAEVSKLAPQTRDADGRRHALALAGDWQLSPDTRLEAEVEHSHQRQPSVPGFSLRGNALPDAGAIDPRINLNNQPWSLPVVLDGDTASLRWRQRLSSDWSFSAHGATQRLRSDDRVAFPFGCYDAVADVYYADRYCPDGRFDLYDYRSDGERRRVDVLDLQFTGNARTGRIRHEISTGVLLARQRDRMPRQAFNYAGSGRDDGSVPTPSAPALTDEGTNRDERSTEWYLRDAMQLTPRLSLWAGLRHTQLKRESARTDGSRAVAVEQSFTTPWLALARRVGESTTVYASWGQGIETDVAPNRSRYVNAGEPLPALRSRQIEAGIKRSDRDIDWSLTAFRITRPLAADIGACDVDASCVRRIDGDVRHEGIEASMGLRRGVWSLRASIMEIKSRRRGAADPALDGLRATNVPEHASKAELGYDVAALPGLRLRAALVHEGPRMVVPDNSIEAGGWTRLDLGARWATKIGGTSTIWQVALDNVTDARAWRETPYQFGHAYLFPLAPRSVRGSVTIDF